MRCISCSAESEWKIIDEYRVVPKGMSICQGCGFVSYPSLYKSEEEIKAHYRTDYRKIPNVRNLFTGLKKIQFHDAFLGPELVKLAERNKAPVIGEVGAAYGMLLNHIKKSYLPEADVSGTELTTTYRRVAYHEYGITLSEDFDLSKKYDVIISYKVAEHQLDADKRLREYALALKDDGFLYISVPMWFDAMTNFGVPGFDLEYYYDTNHINAWTRKLFENILGKAGLEIVKQDHLMYDSTYICRRNDALMTARYEYEDYLEIERRMAAIKRAFECAQQGDMAGAVKAYPNYPDAWVNLYEKRRAEMHEQKQEVALDDILKEFYQPFRQACGDRFETWRFVADVAMRYDNFELALEYWQHCINVRPGDGSVLQPITHCYRRMAELAKDKKYSEALRRKSIEITRHWASSDPQYRDEAISWLYFDLSKLRLPSEV